jgi:hypothetical protein
VGDGLAGYIVNVHHQQHVINLPAKAAAHCFDGSTKEERNLSHLSIQIST